MRYWVAIILLALSMRSVGICQERAAGFPDPYVQLQPQAMPLLKPGVVVERHPEFGWSHLVTIIHPRLGAGAVQSVPEFAGRYASMFKFTVLANVQQAEVNGAPQYWLDRVGVGFAMDMDGQHKILTKDSARDLGASLGMIERGVLGGNEDCLKDMVQIARTERLIVFDAKTNMTVGQTHKMMVLRHLIWVSPNTGTLGFLVWLLDKGSENSYQLAEPHMQLLPAGFQEDRVIHVSEGGLFSRIPTPDRFALLTVPQGTAVPFAAELRPVAALKEFDREDLKQLVTGIAVSLAEMQSRFAQREP